MHRTRLATLVFAIVSFAAMLYVGLYRSRVIPRFAQLMAKAGVTGSNPVGAVLFQGLMRRNRCFAFGGQPAGTGVHQLVSLALRTDIS